MQKDINKLKAVLREKDFDEDKLNSFFNNPVIKNQLKIKIDKGDSFNKLLSFARVKLNKMEDKENTTLKNHTYILSYKANFEEGSDKDKTLHQKIISFIGSIAGITDVSMVSKDGSYTYKEIEVKKNLSEWYTPIKSIVINEQFIYKGEAVKITKLNDDTYIINNCNKISKEQFNNLFNKYSKL